jgi:ribosomal protein S18 acetylase RimI-like enzyme
MSDDEVPGFLADSRARYVADLVGIGQDEDAAMKATGEQLEAMFPGGRPAGGHVLFRIEDGGEPVGALWLGPGTDGVTGRWAVWEIFLEEHHRGRGIGTLTMLLAENEVRSRGGAEMTLSVFGHNDVARHVYEKVGYETTATQMRKVL